MALNNFDHQIKWKEFTGVTTRPANGEEDAEIKVGSAVGYRTTRSGNAVSILDATVKILIIKEDSWVVSDKKTETLKKHEQGHYDITALGTRELYNTLLTYQAESVHTLDEKIAGLKKLHQDDIEACNSRYDNQTKHGLNSTAQADWDKKIAAAKVNPAGAISDLPI